MNNIAPSAADAAADKSVQDHPSHTKGPWRVLEADDTNFCGPFTICDEDNNDLANVYSADDSTVSIPRAEALGNALVMAAAPALLKALKAARLELAHSVPLWCDPSGPHGDESGNVCSACVVVGKIDAAIAKAEGPAAIEAKGAAPARELQSSKAEGA